MNSLVEMVGSSLHKVKIILTVTFYTVESYAILYSLMEYSQKFNKVFKLVFQLIIIDLGN